MKTFYLLLGITLLALTTNNFVWFALTLTLVARRSRAYQLLSERYRGASAAP